MGEGMMSVHWVIDGENLCWSHLGRGAIGILTDERLALFLWKLFIVDFGM